MSYILDALKKAEQERDLGRVPRIETVQDGAPRRARVLPWLIAGILLVNVAALIWWLRPGAHNAVTTPVQKPPRPASPSPAPSPALAPLAPATPAAPPVNRMPAPTVVAPPVATTTPLTQPESLESVKTAVVPVAPSLPTPVAKPVITQLPLLRDLPADFRAEIPTLSLDVHVYAPATNHRFVLINMKKYREGDQLAEGPRIEEITEAGVVLNYRGRTFRIARP